MAELTDDIAVAAGRGDQVALRDLYAALAPSILGYLRAKGVVDPEGVTSDVFVALLPQLRRVSGGASGVRRLAFTIAHARMVDEYRDRARTPPSVSYDPQEDARTVRSAEEEAAQAAATARVRAVLDLLPVDQREVLTLRVVADLTIEQVATVMGRSPGAVKQLQRRGMIAVRKALSDRQVTL